MSVNAQGQLVLNVMKLSALRVCCDCMFSPLAMFSAKNNTLIQNKAHVLNLSLRFSPRLFSYTGVGGTGITASLIALISGFCRRHYLKSSDYLSMLTDA